MLQIVRSKISACKSTRDKSCRFCCGFVAADYANVKRTETWLYSKSAVVDFAAKIATNFCGFVMDFAFPPIEADGENPRQIRNRNWECSIKIHSAVQFPHLVCMDFFSAAYRGDFLKSSPHAYPPRKIRSISVPCAFIPRVHSKGSGPQNKIHTQKSTWIGADSAADLLRILLHNKSAPIGVDFWLRILFCKPTADSTRSKCSTRRSVSADPWTIWTAYGFKCELCNALFLQWWRCWEMKHPIPGSPTQLIAGIWPF